MPHDDCKGAIDALMAERDGLRRERDEARDKAETNACKANRLEEANAQMAAALRELHEAVKAVAPHFEAPVTSENVGLWQRLDAAQKTAATLSASPSPEPEPFGADVGRERLDADAPGHTDLMVSPESIDAFMEANPLPPAPASPSPGLRDEPFHAWIDGDETAGLRDAVIEECAERLRSWVNDDCNPDWNNALAWAALELRALAAKGGDHDR